MHQEKVNRFCFSVNRHLFTYIPFFLIVRSFTFDPTFSYRKELFQSYDHFHHILAGPGVASRVLVPFSGLKIVAQLEIIIEIDNIRQ